MNTPYTLEALTCKKSEKESNNPNVPASDTWTHYVVKPTIISDKYTNSTVNEAGHISMLHPTCNPKEPPGTILK